MAKVRGRPKADDADRLQALAKLLRKDPDLATTTAIRALGVIDPSSIRRLRDKHRKFRRVIPGKSAPELDRVYLTKLFDRLRLTLYPAAQIAFTDAGITLFGGKAAKTLRIPGRASAAWVKTIFIPKTTQFLRRARDHRIVDVMERNISIDEISDVFGVSHKRVRQIRKRTNSAA